MNDASQDCLLRISQIKEENIQIVNTMATKAAQDISQSITHQLPEILAQIILLLDLLTKTCKCETEAAITLTYEDVSRISNNSSDLEILRRGKAKNSLELISTRIPNKRVKKEKTRRNVVDPEESDINVSTPIVSANNYNTVASASDILKNKSFKNHLNNFTSSELQFSPDFFFLSSFTSFSSSAFSSPKAVFWQRRPSYSPYNSPKNSKSQL